MYCSACGSAIPPELSYCNRCGARVGGSKDDSIAKTTSTYPESLVWAIVAVFVCGLGAIIGMMAVMKKVVGFDAGIILAITYISLFMTLAVVGVFVAMLLKTRMHAKESIDNAELKEHQTKELTEGHTVFQEPLSSVTEDPTRAFEPIYRRDAKL